jgi:glycosyltransferase involved in cell wall biosynthesis
LSILRPEKEDISEFVEIVKNFRPHVIHSHLFIAELISREVVFTEVKYFTHCHDNMKQFRNFTLKTLFTKELLTDFYEKQHLLLRYLGCNNNFISISDDTKNYFQSVLPGRLRKNIYSLDNAIVTESFNKANHKRDLNKIRILNVGSFHAKKNQRFLIDITEELIRQGQNVEVVMLGDGTHYEDVKQQVAKRGLEKIILMPGNVVKVEAYYAAANVYVHTATYEPFGLVLIEAMASGLPVVSLDGKGNRGLIKDGENGYMLYEQDAAKFADRIKQVVKDESVYGAMSEKAFAFSKQYDMSGYVKKLLLLYRRTN